MNNDELIAAGHELAKCLDSNTPLLDIAKMIARLADKLEVTTLAMREKTKQCEQIAQAVGWVEGGNFTLAEAVAGHVSGLKAATQRSEELAAENAALKAGVKYFSYSEMAGFEEHSTADLAQKSADADLAGERDEASSEGWSEETDTICWGVILQKAVENKFEKPSEENGWIGWSDYALLPNIETPATDAFLREVRAQDWIEGNEPAEFGRYWVRYETDVGPQYCSAKWMEYNFCAPGDTNIHKIWVADHSRSINSLRGVTHYAKLPEAIEGGAA
ncbi:hypothetical protein ACVS9X_001427 [Cronobacter malonaticus]